MLKLIPPILSPELMKIMMEMGHGDELVLADANFPAASCANRLVRSDGLRIPELLDAVLLFFPLDRSAASPAAVMELLPQDQAPPAWETYRKQLKAADETFAEFEFVGRFEFYERAKAAFAVVATGDMSFKGNVLIKKGVVKP